MKIKLSKTDICYLLFIADLLNIKFFHSSIEGLPRDIQQFSSF